METVRYVQWSDVERFVGDTTSHYKGRISGVYGVPRGGLVLAVMLSHSMNVPLLMAPCNGCLVVDDILDSGDTLAPYSHKGYEIAVMYRRTTCPIQAGYVMDETEGNEWFEYPWENALRE